MVRLGSRPERRFAAPNVKRELRCDPVFAARFGQFGLHGAPQIERDALPVVVLDKHFFSHFHFPLCWFDFSTLAEAGARRKVAPVEAA